MADKFNRRFFFLSLIFLIIIIKALQIAGEVFFTVVIISGIFRNAETILQFVIKIRFFYIDIGSSLTSLRYCFHGRFIEQSNSFTLHYFTCRPKKVIDFFFDFREITKSYLFRFFRVCYTNLSKKIVGKLLKNRSIVSGKTKQNLCPKIKR